MESFTPDNQPPLVGEETAEGDQHPGSQAGAQIGERSVFRLRHPASGLTPGRIRGGRPPLRATSSRHAAAAVGSAPVRANKKTNNGSADKSQQAQEDVQEPAAGAEESGNVAVEISDDDEGEEEVEAEDIGPKRRKLTSAVWKQFKRVKIGGKWKAKCIHCSKKLGGETKNGTKHLHDHLRSCVYVKIKNKGKTLAQSSLRFNSQDQGTSGRVLSEHRSRLTSDLLEALMCSQDWLKNKYKDASKAEAASFWSCLEDIEEGMQKLAV